MPDLRRVCPYGVPRINKEGVSEIDEALCRGCGICAAECPAKAIELNWYEDDQVMSKVDALLKGFFRERFHPVIMPSAASSEGTRRRTWQVPCVSSTRAASGSFCLPARAKWI